MRTNSEMIALHANEHGLAPIDIYASREDYVSHLLHEKAYRTAAELAEGKIVLDLGCNNGYCSSILSKTAIKVIGVDVSPKAIKFAKEHFSNHNVSFLQIDGETLPMKDNEIDLIVSFQVIEHIVDYDKYFNEIKRVLKPTGIALLTTPNAKIRLDPGMQPWNHFHVKEFTHEELSSLFHLYFCKVVIQGLFADEPLYSIEKSRVERNLKAARIKKEKSTACKEKIKQYLPGFILTIFRKLKEKKKMDHLDPSFLKKYNSDNFFYKEAGISEALDLIALCSDDRKAIPLAMEIFNTK